MSARYIITYADNKYFAGWDSLGEISIKDTDKSLAYRMTKTVAERTLKKLPNFSKAKIEQVTE